MLLAHTLRALRNLTDLKEETFPDRLELAKQAPGGVGYPPSRSVRTPLATQAKQRPTDTFKCFALSRGPEVACT
ncbi:hypothetical protein CLOM_g16377 [Closterium sp. NIES-68]|nr:hypothetical protein CLOM_g11458 [Closterium sp. NIES-68]GJP57354.1 hypothetical protein CLOM_g16377 [Closterium sp. NIES-68]